VRHVREAGEAGRSNLPAREVERAGPKAWRASLGIGSQRENIRYPAACRCQGLDLPSHDSYVFDSTQLAPLYFSADHRFVGASRHAKRGQQHVRAPEVSYEYYSRKTERHGFPTGA